MTFWASILKGLLTFFNSLFAYLSASRAEELGRLKEKERQDAANDDLRAAIDRANTDSVSDAEITRGP